MVIGVAYCVHVLSEFRVQMAALGDRREALVKTMSLVGLPSLLTAVTTAVGFASMAFVPIRTMAEGAIYQSFGVMAAYFFSVTVLLAALSFGTRYPEKSRCLGRGPADDRAQRLRDPGPRPRRVHQPRTPQSRS